MRNGLYIFVFIVLAALASCDKGYRVRVTNYYIEPLDSVVVKGSKIVFKNVGLQETTEYIKIPKGKFPIIFYPLSNQEINSQISISGVGSGDFTIQVDGIRQVSILTD